MAPKADLDFFFIHDTNLCYPLITERERGDSRLTNYPYFKVV